MARIKKGIIFGNKITFLAVILIIIMSFFVKATVPIDSIKTPPKKIKYISHEYIYRETVKASPLKFAKGRQGSEEGFRILILRKDKRTEIPMEVYIYNGRGEYLKYDAILKI